MLVEYTFPHKEVVYLPEMLLKRACMRMRYSIAKKYRFLSLKIPVVPYELFIYYTIS